MTVQNPPRIDPVAAALHGWAHPATWVTALAATNTLNLNTSPVTGVDGVTYNYARGFIADADGVVAVTPVGSSTPVNVTVVAGIPYPIAAAVLTPAAGVNIAVLY